MNAQSNQSLVKAMLYLSSSFAILLVVNGVLRNFLSALYEPHLWPLTLAWNGAMIVAAILAVVSLHLGYRVLAKEPAGR